MTYVVNYIAFPIAHIVSFKIMYLQMNFHLAPTCLIDGDIIHLGVCVVWGGLRIRKSQFYFDGQTDRDGQKCMYILYVCAVRVFMSPIFQLKLYGEEFCVQKSILES